MAASDVEQSVESAIATVLNKLDGIFSLKEQTTALKAFVDKKDAFSVLLTGFGKKFHLDHRFCCSDLL